MYNFLIWSYLKGVRKLDTPSKIIGFAFQRHAHRTCLIQPDKNIRYSFHELEQRVKQLIHFFSKKLLKSGDVVAFSSTNSFEYFEIRAAAHMSDLILFALPQHLSEAERAYFLQMVDAKLLFYSVGKGKTLLTAKNSFPTQQRNDDERSEEFSCRNVNAEDIHVIQKRAGVEHCINLESSDYAAIFEKDISYSIGKYKENCSLLLGKQSAFQDCKTLSDTAENSFTFKGAGAVKTCPIQQRKVMTKPARAEEFSCRKIPPQASEIATFNVSSGTTQKTPKIVQLSANNWVASLYNYVLNADMRPRQQIVFLCTLPFATAGSTTFLPSMLAGITTIVMEGDFSAQKTGAFINQCKVNRLYITPSWFIELLIWCKENNEHLSSLENIIIGTERASPATIKEAIAFFGPKITVGYGMVEVLPPIAMLSWRDYFYKGHVREDRLASVGKILKGVSVRIVNENGGDVAVNGPGRIVIKSKTISSGYLDNREETARHFKDGWFFSDDFGFMDKDGFLYVLGRESELLTKTGRGRPIFAKELEDAIYELDCVKHCCATLVHDKNVVLFVSLRPGSDADKDNARAKITAYCDEHVDDSLMPVKIIIKDNLPITPLGKLDRQRLSKEVNE